MKRIEYHAKVRELHLWPMFRLMFLLLIFPMKLGFTLRLGHLGDFWRTTIGFGPMLGLLLGPSAFCMAKATCRLFAGERREDAILDWFVWYVCLWWLGLQVLLLFGGKAWLYWGFSY